MCFPFTVQQKCGVDLLQTAFGLTLNRLVSIHQTMTPHLNRMTFMSALCKSLRIYSAKATRRDSTFIGMDSEAEAVWDCGAARGATETNDRGLLKDARVYKRQKEKSRFFFIRL
jgi:hypothetical protein